MRKKTLLAPESSPTTTNFYEQDIDSAYSSTRSNVVHAAFGQAKRVIPGMVALDDLIAEFSKEEGFVQDLQEGRVWVADKFYADEASIRTLRLKKGISQKELGLLMGTSQSHIARIESGREDLRISTIKKLAQVFNVSLGEMCEIVDHEVCK